MERTQPGFREGRAPLARRFWLYQRERFPLPAYTSLTGVFTLSAASYSRHLRGEAGLAPTGLILLGSVTALAFFFLLRVLDEHKDAEQDRRYRPELPVPRGLVSLPELRCLGAGAVTAALGLNAVLAPVLLGPCLLVAAWTALMTREFFLGAWLRARPAAYLVSHMAVMPLIDAYTTSLDWLTAGAHPEPGLWLFLGVTFLNGTLLEIGRKVRAPEEEREGVTTYTGAWGVRGAPAVWLGVLFAAAAGIWLAAACAEAAGAAAVALAILLPPAAAAALRFVRRPTPKAAKGMDLVSGLWVLFTYLLLGFGHDG